MYCVAVCIDGGLPVMNTEELWVRLVIRDVNDNVPLFVAGPSTSVRIDETSPVGTSVASLPAVDPDAGLNGTIYYALRYLLADGVPAAYAEYYEYSTFYILYSKIYDITLS